MISYCGDASFELLDWRFGGVLDLRRRFWSTFSNEVAAEVEVEANDMAAVRGGDLALFSWDAEVAAAAAVAAEDDNDDDDDGGVLGGDFCFGLRSNSLSKCSLLFERRALFCISKPWRNSSLAKIFGVGFMRRDKRWCGCD